MSHPPSHHNVLDSVDYLRNTTHGHDKFYRAGVMQVEDEWYVVYNWGRGAIVTDPEWHTGQIKYEWKPSRASATNAAVAKVREKQHGGYNRQPAMAMDHYPMPKGSIPDRVYADARPVETKVNSATGQPKKPRTNKPKAPAPISITTKDGQLKPALANRTKWKPTG